MAEAGRVCAPGFSLSWNDGRTRSDERRRRQRQDPVHVKNTGNVALSGITLADSDFATTSCTVPPPTATGAYNAVTYRDTDDAHAFRPVPALTIDKTSVDTTYSAVGDVLDYSFKVTNSRKVTLSGPFTVADDKTTNESCPTTASLAPGAFITCTASHTVTQPDLVAARSRTPRPPETPPRPHRPPRSRSTPPRPPRSTSRSRASSTTAPTTAPTQVTSSTTRSPSRTPAT